MIDGFMNFFGLLGCQLMYSIGSPSLAELIKCPGIIPAQAFMDAPLTDNNLIQKMTISVALAQLKSIPNPYVVPGWITLTAGLLIVSSVVKAIVINAVVILCFVAFFFLKYVVF
jgi:hypothetical protein